MIIYKNQWHTYWTHQQILDEDYVCLQASGEVKSFECFYEYILDENLVLKDLSHRV